MVMIPDKSKTLFGGEQVKLLCVYVQKRPKRSLFYREDNLCTPKYLHLSTDAKQSMIYPCCKTRALNTIMQTTIDPILEIKSLVTSINRKFVNIKDCVNVEGTQSLLV